jgi:ABC-2 type transport system ATP-binding protein
MLHIDALEKSFGFKNILNIRDLKFAPGVHFIIGPNGAGKTTFLKCLAGIHPFHGQIMLGHDLDLKRDPVRHRQQINFSEAEPLFPEYLRGEELRDMVLRVKNGTREQADAFCRAARIDFLRDKVGTYSSGMKKKLALLLAFLGPAQLILLDEPFAAVDQPSRQAITHHIRQRAEAGTSFFISSHQRDLHAAFGEGQVWLLEEKTFRPVSAREAESWLLAQPETENQEA